MGDDAAFLQDLVAEIEARNVAMDRILDVARDVGLPGEKICAAIVVFLSEFQPDLINGVLDVIEDPPRPTFVRDQVDFFESWAAGRG